MVKFKKIFAVSIAVFALILCGLFQSVSISYLRISDICSVNISPICGGCY